MHTNEIKDLIFMFLECSNPACDQIFKPETLKLNDPALCSECGVTYFNSRHRIAANENPSLYQRVVHLPFEGNFGNFSTVLSLAEYYGITGKIIDSFGPWAVTEYGIEYLGGGYHIASEDLNQTDWITKIGLNRAYSQSGEQFKMAMLFALKYFGYQ